MLQNGLAVNPDKSDVIMCGTSQVIAKSATKSVMVVNCNIAINDKVKSFSVILDKCLACDDQGKATCKDIYYHMRPLRHIR